MALRDRFWPCLIVFGLAEIVFFLAEIVFGLAEIVFGLARSLWPYEIVFDEKFD